MRVSLLPASRRDILLHVEYPLEEYAYDAAERFPLAVGDAIEFLIQQPEAGTSSLAALRSWPVPGFPKIRLYYLRPEPSELHVVRILHGARDLPAILRSRKH